MYYNNGNPGFETGMYVYPTSPIQQQPQVLNVNNMMYPSQGNFQQNSFTTMTQSYNSENGTQSPVPQYHGNNPNPNAEQTVEASPAPVIIRSPAVLPLPPKAGTPEGLEHFGDLDSVFVKRKVEYLPIMSAYEKNKKYFVLNGKGEKIYFVAGDEDEDECSCWCLCKGYDPSSPFQMTIVDFSGRPVLLLERSRDWPLYFRSFCKDCTFTCCWIHSTKGKMLVKLPDGTLLGEIEDLHGSPHPNYEINDAEGNLVIRIGYETLSSVFAMLKEGLMPEHTPELIVRKDNGGILGTVKNKYWEDEDTLGVNFPSDLDYKLKCLILACIFLMDFKYSEVQRLNSTNQTVWQ